MQRLGNTYRRLLPHVLWLQNLSSTHNIVYLPFRDFFKKRPTLTAVEEIEEKQIRSGGRGCLQALALVVRGFGQPEGGNEA